MADGRSPQRCAGTKRVIQRRAGAPDAVVVWRCAGREFRREQLQDPKMAEIPILIMSGGRDIEDDASGMNAAGYLRKPFDIDRLYAAVEKYCTRSLPDGLC